LFNYLVVLVAKMYIALDSLGVHPQHQKKGIGKLLLEWGVQEAAKQGGDCYLVATPAGLPLYRAAGFEDVRTVDIFGTPHMSMRKRNVRDL
jgi:GNAT superfamily N-acetyltransferase